MKEREPSRELFLRASRALEVKRPADALRFLTELLAVEPESVKAHCQMALALLELGRNREALNAAERAVGLDPLAEWPQRLRSHAYLSMGKRRHALEAAHACVKLAPAHPMAQFTLGQALLARGKTREALETAEGLRRLAPADPLAHFLLGSVALKQRAWSEAEDHFRKSLELDPNSSTAMNNLGIALEKQGKSQEGIERLHDAARTTPADRRFQTNLDRNVGKYLGGGLSLLFLMLWLGFRLVESLSKEAASRGGGNSGLAVVLLSGLGAVLLLACFGVMIARFIVKRRRLRELHPTVAAFYRDNRKRERRQLPAQLAFVVLFPIALVWSILAACGVGRPWNVPSAVAFVTVICGAAAATTIIIKRAPAARGR